MPIEFDCVCGAEIEALDGQAGRMVMCPRCRSDLTVPPRSTARRPEVVPDLGIDLAGPVRLMPGRRRARRPGDAPAPMNGVGLFSLLCALASYLPGGFAASMAAWLISQWPPPPGLIVVAVMMVYSAAGMALSGFGLMVAGLAGQRVVRPFSAWGFRIAALPFAVGAILLVRDHFAAPVVP